MSKGTYLTSNWLIFAITLVIVAAMVGFSMMQGHLAFEMASKGAVKKKYVFHIWRNLCVCKSIGKHGTE